MRKARDAAIIALIRTRPDPYELFWFIDEMRYPQFQIDGVWYSLHQDRGMIFEASYDGFPAWNDPIPAKGLVATHVRDGEEGWEIDLVRWKELRGLKDRSPPFWLR